MRKKPTAMPFSNKNLTLVYLSKVISVFGSRIFSFGLSFYLLSTTGSSLQFSISLAINFLPAILFSPLAGVINDKIDKKKMLIFCDILCSCVVFMPILTSMSVWGIYLTNFLLSFVSVFYINAVDSFVPSLVDNKGKTSLKQASSVLQMINAISNIGAPLLGGLLIGICSMGEIVFINAISFLLSAFLEFFIHAPCNNNIFGGAKDNTRNEFMQSIKYLREERSVLLLTVVDCVLNFSISLGIVSLLPYVIVNKWGMSSSVLGIFNAMAPIGIVFGSLLFMRRKEKGLNRLSIPMMIWICVAIFLSFSLLLYFFKAHISVPFFILFCIVQLTYGFVAVAVNITIMATKQYIIPQEIMAKVLGVSQAITMALVPIALFMSGYLADKLDSYILPIISTVMVVTIAISVRKRLQMVIP